MKELIKSFIYLSNVFHERFILVIRKFSFTFKVSRVYARFGIHLKFYCLLSTLHPLASRRQDPHHDKDCVLLLLRLLFFVKQKT
jgi:hypothetical protein